LFLTTKRGPLIVTMPLARYNAVSLVGCNNRYLNTDGTLATAMTHQLAINDDCYGLQSCITYTVTEGTAYAIQVDGTNI
jgi:hypothetical protein